VQPFDLHDLIMIDEQVQVSHLFEIGLRPARWRAAI
jgi:hypothetical protein